MVGTWCPPYGADANVGWAPRAHHAQPHYFAPTGTHSFCSIPVTASAGAGRLR